MANDLNSSQADVELLKRSSHLSMSSLATSTCPSQAHHYHYIQYPPTFFAQQTSSSVFQPTTSCHCPCSCGGAGTLQQQAANFQATSSDTSHHHAKQDSTDSQMTATVIVHRQAGDRSTTALPNKIKSEQSLLNHSYQALQQPQSLEQKPLNVSCDCDLECTCGALPKKSKNNSGTVDSLAEAMLGADEITVSESDNNSTIIKKKRGVIHGIKSKLEEGSDKKRNSCHSDIYCDGEDGVDICLKGSNYASSTLNGDETRPPLPPRPPLRPRSGTANINAAHGQSNGIKKYVIWCIVCGGLSCLLGVLFLGVYFLLHSYTITVGNFETIPTFVPATLLILTGVCIMSLARRRNRFNYLIKLSGACGLISALTCALVTVTTTVLHMSRLQSLRECEYAQKTRTCTCYSDLVENQVERGVDKEGVRLVFDSLSDCGVVHGSLYSCLRAIFGISVAGVLVAVFCCMLVYQLLSHERKKMYWEQLELRCRSLYTSQHGGHPPHHMTGGVPGNRGTMCRCCEQCHAHRQVPLPASSYPWDDGGEPRFWTGQPPGNFYSPNPGGEDLHLTSVGALACRGSHTSGGNTRSRATGWSWPRMPWQRSSHDETNTRFRRQTPSSPDSQYGFSNNNSSRPVSGTVEAIIAEEQHGQQQFNAIPVNALPYGVWGPPPPYSDPNSPARRGYYHYIQPMTVCSSNNLGPNNHSGGMMSTGRSNTVAITAIPNEQTHDHMAACSQHACTIRDQSNNAALNSCCIQNQNQQQQLLLQTQQVQTQQTSSMRRQTRHHSKGIYENTPSDSDCGRDRISNTLPSRKPKKRVEAGIKSIGSNSQPAHRVNVQNLFPELNEPPNEQTAVTNEQDNAATTSNLGSLNETCNNSTAYQPVAASRQLKKGVENSAFQNSSGEAVNHAAINNEINNEVSGATDAAESEIYFADVSSCCNMSVKNDNYYEDAKQHQATSTPQHHQHHHRHQHSNCSHNSSHSANSNANNNEDYLSQRFGQRENSIRSRLPFPQNHCNDFDDQNKMVSSQTTDSLASSTHHRHFIPKDISHQSMCSVESEAKTEFTDLSPATPCGNKFENHSQEFNNVACLKANNSINISTGQHQHTPPNFVASFPYCSEAQSLEAHRRSTKNIHELMLASDAHYEIINDVPGGVGVVGHHHTFSVSPSLRTPKQRPSNLPASSNLHTPHKTKSRNKTKSRERLDRSDKEWSEGSGGGIGGGGGSGSCSDRQRL